MREWSMGMGLAAVVLVALSSGSYAESVGVFYDPEFSETGPGIGDEAGEIVRSIQHLGHTVDLFEGGSTATWSDAAAANDALLMPEPEQTLGGERTFLAARVGGLLRDYVGGGGRLIVVGEFSGANAAFFLNDVFGYSLTKEQVFGPSSKTPGAAGTLFATGPDSLPANVETSALRNLPASATSAYSSGSDHTVVQFAFGSGAIVYLGWDWFNAFPRDGGQDGGWLATLDLAILRGPPGSGPPDNGPPDNGPPDNGPPDNGPPNGGGGTPVPEPGTLALVGLAAAGLIAHRRRRRA